MNFTLVPSPNTAAATARQKSTSRPVHSPLSSGAEKPARAGVHAALNEALGLDVIEGGGGGGRSHHAERRRAENANHRIFHNPQPFICSSGPRPCSRGRLHFSSGPFPGISHRFFDAMLRAPCRTCIEGDYSIEVKRNDRPCASLEGTISDLPQQQANSASHGPIFKRTRRLIGRSRNVAGCRRDGCRPAGALNWRVLLVAPALAASYAEGDWRMITMAKRIPEDAGINTRLTHGGNDPLDYLRLHQSAGRACLDGAFPGCGDAGLAPAEIHLRHARHAHHRRAGQGDRRTRRFRRHHHRSVRADGGHRSAAGLPVGGRPSADRRFGLLSRPATSPTRC